MRRTRMINLGRIDDIKDVHEVVRYLNQNQNKIVDKVKTKLSELTDEHVDVIRIYVNQFSVGVYNLVMSYAPKYLFSEIKESDLNAFLLWIRNEVIEGMKIVQETTQASAIANHPATHAVPKKEVKKTTTKRTTRKKKVDGK